MRKEREEETEITGNLNGAGEPFYDEQKSPLDSIVKHGALTLTHFSAEKQGGYQDLIFKRGKRRELAIGRFGTMGRTLRDLADNTTAVEGLKKSNFNECFANVQ